MESYARDVEHACRPCQVSCHRQDAKARWHHGIDGSRQWGSLPNALQCSDGSSWLCLSGFDRGNGRESMRSLLCADFRSERQPWNNLPLIEQQLCVRGRMLRLLCSAPWMWLKAPPVIDDVLQSLMTIVRIMCLVHALWFVEWRGDGSAHVRDATASGDPKWVERASSFCCSLKLAEVWLLYLPREGVREVS